jgi:hypothetical protein
MPAIPGKNQKRGFSGIYACLILFVVFLMINLRIVPCRLLANPQVIEQRFPGVRREKPTSKDRLGKLGGGVDLTNERGSPRGQPVRSNHIKS